MKSNKRQFVKEAKKASTQNAYNDMMGAPLDVAKHPVRSLPEPSGGSYGGVLAPFQNQLESFEGKTDPFNIGA